MSFDSWGILAATCCCALLLYPGCGDSDRDDDDEGLSGDSSGGDTFPCGQNGGNCAVGTEVCIDAGACSTCVPRPVSCDTDATCGCLPPGDDEAWGTFKCTDAGTCDEVEGGLVRTCAAPDGWGCA